MIELKNAVHRYNADTVIHLPDLHMEQGEQRLLIGPSGCGKSTLLHILAGILKPSEGTLSVCGTDLYALSEAERDTFRGRRIGLIFQQMHLIDSISVLENIVLAGLMAGLPRDRSRAEELCRRLEIHEKLHAAPDTLSQGQKQRVSIARAVMNRPAVILADEPTSSLDDERAAQVIGILKEQAAAVNATLVISTHDHRLTDHIQNRTQLGATSTRKENGSGGAG